MENNMNSVIDAPERMETGFVQTKFLIEKVSKNSTQELGFEPQQSIKLSISRSFSVETEGEDFSKVKMKAIMSLVLENEKGENLDFLVVHAAFQFKVNEDYQNYVADKNYQKLLAVQANVQLTDFVNSVLMNSELKGDKLSYEI